MTDSATVTGTKKCPIAFDHHSIDHARNWESAFKDLREENPRAWSQCYGGFWLVSKYQDLLSIAQKPDSFTRFWLVSKYQDLLSIAQKPDSFTSAKYFDPATGHAEGGVTIPPYPSPRVLPSETESPEWNTMRGFLNNRFAPKAVERFRPQAQHLAAALVDRFIERGSFDVIDDLTNPLPALVTMELFGLPADEWPIYAEAVHKMVYVPQDDPEFAKAIAGIFHFRQRMTEEIEARREAPDPAKDDLIGYFAAGEIDGQPVDIEAILSMSVNILAGGVDTTTSLTSNALLYLSRHPDQRQQLIDDPGLLPRACEEFVRYFTPLQTLARTAKEDVVVRDWAFDKDDRVLFAYASANRDPDIFEDPDELKLDRFPNRHLAFGAGMHRCLGSFLARIMFQAMMTEVLTRLPDYRIDESAIEPYTSVGSVNGWIRMPATFTPGAKVGAVI